MYIRSFRMLWLPLCSESGRHFSSLCGKRIARGCSRRLCSIRGSPHTCLTCFSHLCFTRSGWRRNRAIRHSSKSRLFFWTTNFLLLGMCYPISSFSSWRESDRQLTDRGSRRKWQHMDHADCLYFLSRWCLWWCSSRRWQTDSLDIATLELSQGIVVCQLNTWASWRCRRIWATRMTRLSAFQT